SVDEIAERILMVGGQPLHTFADYLKVADLKEAGFILDSKKGVEVVLENSRYLLKSFNEILELADGDEGTSALMSDLIGGTEKRIWMLESTLG
ncbi:MAG: ferritin-like domain-containing protein, partial [Ignavibacteriaceae bacterium]